MSTYEEAIRDELAHWPGVTVRFSKCSKHGSAVFHFAGATRFTIIPNTPSDSARGHLNCIADMRAELRALGAVRTVKRPASRKKAVRGPRRTRPERIYNGERAPVKPDPWLALLNGRASPNPPTRSQTLWERFRVWLRG